MPGVSLDDSARRLGAIVWTERRLFELLGGWVASTAEPAVKVAFARISRRHGDHAVALVDVLPDTRDHEPERLVAPLGDETVRLDAASACEATPERLASVTGAVASHHLEALERYLADASPVRDGPALRAVAAVLGEDRAGFDELRALAAG